MFKTQRSPGHEHHNSQLWWICYLILCTTHSYCSRCCWRCCISAGQRCVVMLAKCMFIVTILTFEAIRYQAHHQQAVPASPSWTPLLWLHGSMTLYCVAHVLCKPLVCCKARSSLVASCWCGSLWESLFCISNTHLVSCSSSILPTLGFSPQAAWGGSCMNILGATC